MELGISSYSFPWNIGVAGFDPPQRLTATDLLQYAIESGIRRVQFGDNLPLHLVSQEELHTIAQFAEANKLTIEVGTRGLTLANMLRYLELAKVLNSSFVRVVIDDAGYEPTVEQVIHVLKEILPSYIHNGVLVAIENHDRFSSVALKSIIEKTDAVNVTICLDTANSFGALEGTYETVNILAPYTINLHIKDVEITRVPHKMGFRIRGTAAGEGALDIQHILQRVHREGKCISATLEIWSDFDTDIVVTTRREKEMVERSINYLKQYFT